MNKQLSARTEYLTKRSFASYHVKTPDPNLNFPPIGQRLILSWHIPKKHYSPTNNYSLTFTLRFNNGQQYSRTLNLTKREGVYTYNILNEGFFATCGIQTYKLELFCEGQKIDCWYHQLWAEKIELNP